MIATHELDGPPPGQSFGRAWRLLAGALIVHVADEALTGFLDVYNPAVLSLRGRVPWLPLPTFTFWPWLLGLAAGITLLFALGPLATRGQRWLVLVALPFSGLMVGNALGHLAGSLYLQQLLPGAWSSPLLLAAALLTFVRAWRLRWPRRVQP